MMTDAMKPLGLSVWQLTAGPCTRPAGGCSSTSRRSWLRQRAAQASWRSWEIRSADQGRARRPFSNAATSSCRSRTGPGGALAGGAPAPIETDPAIVAELIGRSQASITASKRDIPTKSGSALLDFILADIQELRRISIRRAIR